MKKQLLLIISILLLATIITQGQVISYPTGAQPITRGFDSTVLTIKIDFPACTSPLVTINLGATYTPGTIEYIPGSLAQIGGSAGITIAESNISNLSSPQFSVSSTSAGQHITFTIKRRIGCGSAASSKDAVVVSGGCSFSETDPSVNTYNILAPGLTLSPPTSPLPNTGVGSSYNRTFSVNNGGNGCLDTLFVWVKYPTGCATLNSLKIGTTTLTAAYSNGDSSLFKVFGANLTSDGKFCNGESITFTENFTVLKCNFTTTYGTAWNEYTNNICQFAIGSADITMNNNLPNISASLVTPTASQYSYCFLGDYKTQTVRITNNGAGAATNVQLYIRTFVPGSFGSILRLDTTGGFAIKNSVGTVIGTIPRASMTVLSTSGIYNASCALVNTAIQELRADLPSSIIIPAGGYIDVDVTTYTYNLMCNNCYTSLAWFGFSSQVAYKNQCGLGAYQEAYKLLISRVSSNFNFTVENPTDVSGVAPNNTFDFSISTTQFRNLNNPDGTGTTYLVVPLAGTGLLPNASSIVVGGVTLPIFMQNDSMFVGPLPQNTTGTFENKVFKLPMKADCTAGGGTKTLSFFVLNSYSSCAPVRKQNCTSSTIIIHCPLPCPLGGATPTNFNLRRINYGLPDNDNNGQPDAAGTIDLTKIFDHRSVNGDTLMGSWDITVNPNVEPTDPNVGQNFKYVYIDFNLVQGANPLGSKGSLNALNGAVATIYPAGGGAPFTCTINPVISGTIAHYELNSACRGGDWQAGDRIEFNAKYTVNQVNNYTYNRLYEGGLDLFQTRIEVYSTYTQKTSPQTAPINAQTYTCDHFNDFNQMSKIWLSAYIAASQIINGCTGSISSHMRQYTRFQEPNNIFLYEYRNFYIPDTMKVQIPPGFIYRSGSGTFAGIAISDANVEAHGDTLYFINLRNYFKPYGGTNVPGDETSSYTITFNVNPTCAAAAGITPSYTNSFGIGNSINTPASDYFGPSSVNASGYIYNPPQPQLTGGGSVNSTDGNGTWSVILQNISNSVASDNTWFYIDPIVGLSNIVVKEGATVISPDVNGFYRIGNLASGANRTFTITATSTTCTPDSMRINMGFDCSSYPTSFSLQSCTKTTWLKLVNLESQIQLTVAKQPIILPATTIDLCTPGTAEFVINSALAAFADNPVFNVYPPTGLTITSGEIEYPLGSGNWQTITPIITGIVNSYPVESHTQLQALWGTKGLPGTLDFPGTAQRQAKLKLTFTTNCNFASGAKIAVQQQAWRPCGDAISSSLGFNNIVRTDPINVTGAPTTAAASMDINLSPTTATCESIAISGSAIPVAIATTTRDTVEVILPQGIIYDPGSFSSPDGATLAAGSPFSGTGGSSILKIKIPSGIAPGTTIAYTFSVTPGLNSGCGNLELVSDYVRTSAPLSCNGTSCPNDSKSILGTDVTVVNIQKADPTITNMQLVSGLWWPGESPTVAVTVKNNSTINMPGSTYYVEFFCGLGTTPIAVSLFPATVPPGQTVTANITFTVNNSCAAGYLITAKIRQNSTLGSPQCICSDVSYTYPVALPVQLESFTVSGTNCGATLNWKVATESNMAGYEVEMSLDGIAFNKTTFVTAKGSNTLYKADVNNIISGTRYFRLKMIDKDGTFTYSNIASAKIDCGQRSISIYPNPVVDKININIIAFSGKITGRLYNSTGQLVSTVVLNNGNNKIDITPLPNGLYNLIIVDENGHIVTHKLAKNL